MRRQIVGGLRQQEHVARIPFEVEFETVYSESEVEHFARRGVTVFRILSCGFEIHAEHEAVELRSEEYLQQQAAEYTQVVHLEGAEQRVDRRFGNVQRKSVRRDAVEDHLGAEIDIDGSLVVSGRVGRSGSVGRFASRLGIAFGRGIARRRAAAEESVEYVVVVFFLAEERFQHFDYCESRSVHGREIDIHRRIVQVGLNESVIVSVIHSADRDLDFYASPVTERDIDE